MAGRGDAPRVDPRPSPAKNLFCALIGTGAQLVTIAASVFALAAAGAFAPVARGVVQAALIGLHAATAPVAGAVAGSYYRQMGGVHWVRNVLLTAGVAAVPLGSAFCVANSVAAAHGSTQALPAGTIVAIAAIWGAVTLPLTVVGGVVGKNRR